MALCRQDDTNDVEEKMMYTQRFSLKPQLNNL